MLKFYIREQTRDNRKFRQIRSRGLPVLHCLGGYAYWFLVIIIIIIIKLLLSKTDLASQLKSETEIEQVQAETFAVIR